MRTGGRARASRLVTFAALAAAGWALAGGAQEHQDGAAPPAYHPLTGGDEESAAGSVVDVDEREVDGPLSGGGIGRRIVVLEVTGVIDLGMAPFIVRTLRKPAGVDLFVLDINTPGGRVDAALMIRDALLESEVRTVAFIHPRAISAGALVSYACDTIAMAPGGSIGAATPVTLQPGGGAQAVSEKIVSYFRAEMASTARAKGRRGDIAEAMVDKEVEIEGVTQRGKLLTLDTDNALELGVADLEAEDLEGLLEGLRMDGADVERPGPTWAEKVARILTHPAVSGLLMALGFLGILIELYSPGFGAPGIVGIVCLLVFFLGHLVVHLAGWEELLIFGVGVVLLVLEVFVTPGFGVLGVLGAAAVLTSLVMALVAIPIEISIPSGAIQTALLRVIASMAGAVAAFALVAIVLPRTRAGGPLVLLTRLPLGSSHGRKDQTPSGAPRGVEVGDTGTALTILRPAGKVRLGSRSVMAITEGDFIDRRRSVVVVRIEGDKVFVRENKR